MIIFKNCYGHLEGPKVWVFIVNRNWSNVVDVIEEWACTDCWSSVYISIPHNHHLTTLISLSRTSLKSTTMMNVDGYCLTKSSVPNHNRLTNFLVNEESPRFWERVGFSWEKIDEGIHLNIVKSYTKVCQDNLYYTILQIPLKPKTSHTSADKRFTHCHLHHPSSQVSILPSSQLHAQEEKYCCDLRLPSSLWRARTQCVLMEGNRNAIKRLTAAMKVILIGILLI